MSLVAWQADQLQCALFTLPGAAQMDAAELWPLVTKGGSPDAYQRPNVSIISGSVAQGRVDGFQLVISSQPGRVDLFLTAEQRAEFNAPPRIDDITAALERLRGGASELIAKLRTVRVALIANLSELHDREDQVSARITELCGGIWFPNPPLDCLYQVNLRRPFSSADHLMNRVLTWSAGNYQIFAQLASGGFLTGIPMPAQKLIPFVSFKIDVNSFTNTEITNQAPDMYSETENELLALIQDGVGRLRG